LTEDQTDELRYRIENHAAHHGGRMPERHAIAWRGYLAALLEWDQLALPAYERLLALLPKVADDPAIAILRGYDEE
jgi:hypothetical protein